MSVLDAPDNLADFPRVRAWIKSIGDMLGGLPDDIAGLIGTKADNADLQELEASVYPASVVDGMFGADLAVINARQPMFEIRSGLYYSPLSHGLGRSAAIGGAAMTADNIYFSPIYIPEQRTFDRIGINVTTLQASSSARLGIFTMDLAAGVATLIHDAGTVPSTATGVQEITISQQLGPGWYWLGIQPTHAIAIHAAAADRGIYYSTSGAVVGSRVQTGGASGAFSATEAALSASGNIYAIFLRAA